MCFFLSGTDFSVAGDASKGPAKTGGGGREDGRVHQVSILENFFLHHWRTGKIRVVVPDKFLLFTQIFARNVRSLPIVSC